jgi:hypothetical protein
MQSHLKVQVEIPYSTGMSPYSGLVDLFEAKGLLKKEGNSLVYTTKEGEIIKQFRKAWEKNEKEGLSIIMEDISTNGEKAAEPGIVEDSEEA